MHLRVTTSSNINRWLRRFEKKKNKLRDDVAGEPRTQARFGQQLGRAIAPRDKGVLINAISWKVMDKSSAMIWVKPLMNDHRPASKYAAIHHKIGDRGSLKTLPWQVKPSTGDFHWMFMVKDELERRYGKAVRGHIQKFIR